MTRVHIVHHHHGRKDWPPVQNHLDGRVCPTCGAGVFGRKAQQAHHRNHLENREYQLRVNAILAALVERTGITEDDIRVAFDVQESGHEWSWGAEVTGVEEAIEAAE